MALAPELIQKYNRPVPRYTSYPTVPFWDNDLNSESWQDAVQTAFQTFGKAEGISLYIHLPFCESLCTYCGCNKRITKNHGLEAPYLDAILAEWKQYLSVFAEKPQISAIHLGGGTPTFFSPQSLQRLLSDILASAEVSSHPEFSFEGHPNNTTREHLQVLAGLGFDRVSYGIQDFDQTVQRAIHRIQPFEKVKAATENARMAGYRSVNFDLIYGLPFQTPETLSKTFDRVAELRPERIAFYSYAHLPASFPAQRSYEKHLPKEKEKRALYELGRARLVEMGYEEVGMDHFALPEDPLCPAKRKGTLHRNFMGYTTQTSHMLLGLGASSISDVWFAFAQNEKSVEGYQSLSGEAFGAMAKGHLLSPEDLVVRQVILDLICCGEAEIPFRVWEKVPVVNKELLEEMQTEGLLVWDGFHLKVSQAGMAVVRNICALFDLRMAEKTSRQPVFSKAI
ncbi:oxygen-independent coproporphyrinogen III oxidase [Algoriphagus sp. H41]|uniref:Coproporphyrinogen-III oxidase n=1 Tax=Algoriphagus oliviformis TaxID=2811231 RepID=A0ABS3C869_9BACT|nr:oxygen-independent coproporphyrinogen III oxidase [Algoriphagus oliviformis]MBN7812356.1 oxygen-independent coproporphyrinogen III oxidase [Algoriphagus oliviformis]